MPEMSFHVRWPDGSAQRCFSPSTIVTEHLAPGTDYPLEDFVARSRTALHAGSERVRAKYGFACSSAAATLADIEARAATFGPDTTVTVEKFGA